MNVTIAFPDKPLPSLFDTLEYEGETYKWYREWKNYIESCDWIARRYLEMQFQTLLGMIKDTDNPEKEEE